MSIEPDDVAQLTYEQALAELDALIERLEGGQIALDEAITAYERGARLTRRCSELLDRTEQRISQLVVGGDGSLKERPLEVGKETPESAADTPPRARPVPVAPAIGAEPSPLRQERLRVDPDDIPF